MKNAALLIATLSLAGCAAMTDSMDNFSNLGKFTVDQNSFDSTTIVSVTPDILYNPEGGILGSVSTRLGAVWTSQLPDFVNLAFQEDGGFVGFKDVSFKVDGEVKNYKIGLSDLDMDQSRLAGMKSTAYALMPVSDFKNLLSAKSCQLKIQKDSSYEIANCTIDRAPGGKKTAILGLRKILKAINSQTMK